MPIFFWKAILKGHRVREGLSGGGISSLRKENWTQPGRVVNTEAVSDAVKLGPVPR